MATVGRLVDDQATVDGDADFVLDGRDEPGGGGVLRMGRHRKTEGRRLDVGQFMPLVTTVSRVKNAVVVLDPLVIGFGSAYGQAMRVLDGRLERLVGRHVLGTHALARASPSRASVVGLPDAATGDADRDMRVIAWIDPN